MQFLRKSLLGCWICGLLALWPAGVWAQTHNQFVYVNDNPSFVANTIEGFAVASNGVLTALPGSPYLTGGVGGGDGFSAVPRLALRAAGNFLYVSNEGSSNISIFKLNSTTGIPTLSASGPVPTHGLPGGPGIGMALSPDGKFLFAGNGGSNSISAFSIGPAGGLDPVPNSPFATNDSPSGIIVTRDSKFVIDAELNESQIGVAAIGPDGSLTPVSGSPFPAAGLVTGLDVDCSGQHVFVGDLGSSVGASEIEVYTIGSDGTLTPIPGSPFAPKGGTGAGSENVMLNSTGHFLYVSNLFSATVTTFRVNGTTGALSVVAGDPFLDGNTGPSGIATDPASHFIFTAIDNSGFSGSTLGVLTATGDGKLAQVPGSPFLLALHSHVQSVQAFPTKTCKP